MRRYRSIVLLAALLAWAAAPARAQVAQLDAWTLRSSSNPGGGSFSVNAGAPFTVSAGSQRLLVVAAVFEAGTASTLTNFNATLGGTPLTAVVASDTSQLEAVKVWYLPEVSLPAGAAQLVVSGTYAGGNLSGLHVYSASFTGVDQASPVVSSSANFAAAASRLLWRDGQLPRERSDVLRRRETADRIDRSDPADRASLSGSGRRPQRQTSFTADAGVQRRERQLCRRHDLVTFGGTTTNWSALAVVSLRPAVADLTIAKTDSADPILLGQPTTTRSPSRTAVPRTPRTWS